MPTKAKPTACKNPQRTLLLDQNGSEFKVVIPAGSRITFGPTIPFKKGGNSYSGDREGYSLRVYADAGNDSLIAVFCDVRSFRDEKLPYAKLLIREAGKAVWKSDQDGYKVEQEVKVEKTFENLKQLT